MSLFKKKNKYVDIKPNQDFLDGRTRYVKGKKYRVEANLARYFANNGWLEGDHPAPPPSVSIEIDDSSHGVTGGLDG